MKVSTSSSLKFPGYPVVTPLTLVCTTLLLGPRNRSKYRLHANRPDEKWDSVRIRDASQGARRRRSRSNPQPQATLEHTRLNRSVAKYLSFAIMPPDRLRPRVLRTPCIARHIYHNLMFIYSYLHGEQHSLRMRTPAQMSNYAVAVGIFKFGERWGRSQ